VRDDVNAFCGILCEDDVACIAREKISHHFAGAFVTLGRLSGQAMRTSSVVTRVPEEVFVYRFHDRRWRLTRSRVV
jgi:hypothetical protein